MESAAAQRFLTSVTATIFLLLLHSTVVNSHEIPTAYEVLEDYNFPVGLLPDGVVTGYELNPFTGEFTAYLSGNCSLFEGGYQVKYEPVIRGLITQGKLSKLEGVSVVFFRKWRNIVQIIRHGNHVYFSVGMASERFHVKDFEESPQCDCGLNCSLTS